jgi:hypothetical protein
VSRESVPIEQVAFQGGVQVFRDPVHGRDWVPREDYERLRTEYQALLNMPEGARRTRCKSCGWTFGTHAPDCDAKQCQVCGETEPNELCNACGSSNPWKSDVTP